MCGRYLFSDGTNPTMERWIAQAKQQLSEEAFRELSFHEVFPSHKVLIIMAGEDHKARLLPALWGYPGREGKLIINARSETAFDSFFFRGSLPCVIPATGYYEWSRDPKKKYYFTVNEKPMYLAGLCRKEEDGMHMVILTEAAVLEQAEIHDRQPVILSSLDIPEYCQNTNPKETIKKSIRYRNIREAE